mmetsp:Transcript_15466/g.13504  ORF Transcript_15466/g.13504 Transcript_15466/m.13504 type:complete len:116 (+) Transcript_15466:569-916(+)
MISGLYSTTFFIIGLIFALVGINFYQKFKAASPDIAVKKRSQIFVSICIIFFSFFIRGANSIICAIMETHLSFRLNWLENGSIPVIILMSLYYFVIDIVPSIHLSFGIWMITRDY